VADDAAAMLGRAASGGGGEEEEELSWVGEKRRRGGSVQTKPRAEGAQAAELWLWAETRRQPAGGFIPARPTGGWGLGVGWDDGRCDDEV
jgi:hypothetical protein